MFGIKYMRLPVLLFYLLFTIANSTAQKFWLTTYEFPYGPKTGIGLINDSILFAGTENKVIKSTNSGYHFSESLKARAVYTIFVSPSGKVYAGGKGKIYKTENMGITWDSVSVNSKYPVVQIIESSHDKLFAVTNGYDVNREEMSGDNILFSDNGGASWSIRNTGLKQYGGCNKIAIDKNNRLYVAVEDDNVTGVGGLYVSDNDGLNWMQVGISYDGQDAISGSPRIQRITGLSILKNDSVYVSFQGIAVNAEVRLNVRKHIHEIFQDNAWDVYKVSNTNTWWLDRPLNDIYQAVNGDLYSSYSYTANTGGTYFRKAGNYPWNRIDKGLGLDVTGVRTHQYFAETSGGKIYMIQMYDERIYWADTSAVTDTPTYPENVGVFFVPSILKSGEMLHLKVLSGENCEYLSISDLSGKTIFYVLNKDLIQIPRAKGIYLLRVKIDGRFYVRKIIVF